MKLALLAGASPRVCEQGPLVRLAAGVWNIIAEGLVDSKLALCEGTSTVPLNGVNEIVQDEGGSVFIKFLERGSESHISVYAECH